MLVQEKVALGNPADFGIQAKIKFTLVLNCQCFATVMTSSVQRIQVTFIWNMESEFHFHSLAQNMYIGVHCLFHSLLQTGAIQERNTKNAI